MIEFEPSVYRTAVDALPPLTRAVFLLHRIDGLGYTEIAMLLRIGTDDVTDHIAEALCGIDRALRAKGY